MKLLLDTCVLYPTVMREMLLGAARLGLYTPLWSERILEEWRRAALKLGPEGAAQAQAEVAMLQAGWPGAVVPPAPAVEARLWLPDAADLHVLAAAISGHADGIVTMNAKDFPRHTLAEEGLKRIGPDELLYDLWLQEQAGMEAVGAAVLAEANRLSGGGWQMRPLLKKARLPRLAKALAG
ncbi:PIN domain-containing protein [Phaeobacter sp. QD34_3]|uniref:RSP_2648 family PIN domain-containing protein n=1 Tax=unclassified Phaeobacter TaxID=2621772 RepID=UPI00237F3700|nr:MULTISPECIES: PIN domain-containing protein [unclassified Phaeobacter]MDE4134202.1 PIN domain-containing protein [Phaeobacter sp. QD34_3]MDE4137875.1 PIN domain-containing protein [Phaeobacter sp. QD34_24]MDE4175172.1 PIN domain-containing protein [Phaeobacter sp. PT47_59]